jgi:anti-sigma regulatory factor (Ser/Thr protein kinase)
MVFRQTALRVTEASEAGKARRMAARAAENAGFDDEDARGRLAIIVTEAARNLAQHGQDGELLLRAVEPELGDGIEVITIDRGPGMASVAECLRDGYSTRGTPGTGLGAIRRLADDFDIFSQPDRGTVLVARVRAHPGGRHPRRPPMVVGAISMPYPGEQVCGDDWALKLRGRHASVFLLVDGLGHGVPAAEAADEAVRLFRSRGDTRAPKAIMETLHAGMRATRGAAAGVVEIDRQERQVRYAAVGNVAGAILTHTSTRNMLYSNGTLGHEVRKVHEFTYSFPEGATIILYSDGLATWNLDRYPGVLSKDPAIIAALLYRDFRRTRDDVTVLVARETQGQQ